MNGRRKAARPHLGNQELEVLRFVAERAPVTVRAVAEEFGGPRGLARTTILTVMERLREKGFLTRSRASGQPAFEYAPLASAENVTRDLVRDFVQVALGGDIGPLIAYLDECRPLSEGDAAALRRLAESADRRSA